MRVILLVSLAHATTDAYAAFLAPLLPRLMDKLGLSIALAATLAMTLSLAASVLQPLMGYLADRVGRRWFVAAGPFVAGLFLSLIGLAPSFAILVAVLVLGGLGSAAFHPPGASYVARVEEGGGAGMRLTVFSMGGTFGFAAGPLIAVALVGTVGLGGMWVAMLPGLALGVVVVLFLPPDRPPVAQRPPRPGEVLGQLVGALGVLFGISSVMAFAQRVFLTLQPIVVAEAGGSEAAGALSLSAYLGAQVFGTLLGGFLTDRADRRRTLLVLVTLALPAHLAAVALPPATPAALVAAAAAGLLGMAVLPPIIVMAQEILPQGAAVGSGIVMGLAWAAGSLGVLLTGVLGDVIGPQAAAAWSMPVILLAVGLTLHPSLRPHARPAA